MTTTVTATWRAELDTSRTRVLALADAGRADPAGLRRLADFEAVLAFRLLPCPADPVAHVRAGYAMLREHLARLADHPPGAVATIANEDGYVYTFRPRTVLRRVLDHALDHHNQIEQWLAWRAGGPPPTPTDGWASSEDQLPEDALPLTAADLRAWLWRLDLVWAMLAERAARLTPDELDWQPPDGGWTLGRTLTHVSGGFYTVWLDEALPDDPRARYAQASARFAERLTPALAGPPPPGTTYFARDGERLDPAQALADGLAAEERLLAGA